MNRDALLLGSVTSEGFTKALAPISGGETFDRSRPRDHSHSINGLKDELSGDGVNGSRQLVARPVVHGFADEYRRAKYPLLGMGGWVFSHRPATSDLRLVSTVLAGEAVILPCLRAE
jgi:hypothetical protein